LKGNWSKYGTIGQKIHKISLFGMFSIAYFGQGKNGSKQNGLEHSFQDQKKTAGQHFHQAGIINSGMISSAIQLFVEDF
jgi:hypothetical protein